AAYKRKLTAYQEGQQRQAQLVQKLQAKVDLGETSNGRHRDEASNNLEEALIRLEEEQQRSSSLAAVNAMLREQLEQAGLANEALSQDIRRLTVDWTKAREELEQKDFCFWVEVHKLIWTKHFLQKLLSPCVSRDLTDMRSELTRISHSARVSCSGLSASVDSRVAGEKALRTELEQQLRNRVVEMMNLQSRADAERSELNLSITELSLQLSKLQSEDAALRDSVVKMGSMNEVLAQDKVDLNNYILKVRRLLTLLEEAPSLRSSPEKNTMLIYTL
uniref:Rootletin-like coiled-coil domain-containing protein n=1 Tax=Cyprinodon variegatus TaxID=28743 RepID=A0A3Q2DL06_CYPVA